MTELLRLLPLLVVGCLLLKSLQPTAFVNGQLDESEADGSCTDPNYDEHGTLLQQLHLTCDVSIKYKLLVSCMHSMYSQNRRRADNRLENKYKICPLKHLEQHLPFKYDASSTTDANNLKGLCQDGYIIIYSTRRKTPLFTAERLDGVVLKAAVRKFFIHTI